MKGQIEVIESQIPPEQIAKQLKPASLHPILFAVSNPGIAYDS